MAKRYFIRERDVPAYHPANHSGTTNRRLIGPETVGAKNVEVLLGVIEKGAGAARHAHPGVEQVCYLLEGSSLENLIEVADFFLPLTNATFYLGNSSAASMQRELVIVNKEKVQAMYLLPAPTTTQRLDDAPHPPTSPLTNPIA